MTRTLCICDKYKPSGNLGHDKTAAKLGPGCVFVFAFSLVSQITCWANLGALQLRSCTGELGDLFGVFAQEVPYHLGKRSSHVPAPGSQLFFFPMSKVPLYKEWLDPGAAVPYVGSLSSVGVSLASQRFQTPQTHPDARRACDKDIQCRDFAHEAPTRDSVGSLGKSRLRAPIHRK